MLLAIDIGNTNITIGLFKENDIICTFRMTTKLPRTSDEYGIFLLELIRTKGVTQEKIKDVIIASVVPNIMHSFNNAIVKYLNKKPIMVGPGIKTGIKIATENPKEVGSDRIVDAVAAYTLYGGPVLVIDYGTATTYDLILQDGSFVAGVISPGIRISANAFWKDTARLPEIEIKKPNTILARETISSMQAGLVYGYIGQTEYIIRKMQEEAKLSKLIVVATGGLGKIIVDETKLIHIYNPNLTLQGLKIIYDKQR